jgi:hypothetical protein
MFIFSVTFRPALGSTQPPIQWLLVVLPRLENDRGVKMTTDLPILSRIITTEREREIFFFGGKGSERHYQYYRGVRSNSCCLEGSQA